MRHSTRRGKTYRYQIYLAEVMSPFLIRYAWHYPYRARRREADRGGQSVVGARDFTAFTVAGSEASTFTRTITEVAVEREGVCLDLFFTGDGFLRYQVRTMVAALVESNRGRLQRGSIPEINRKQGSRARRSARSGARVDADESRVLVFDACFCPFLGS